MIGSTTCFSIADLRDMSSRLFGKIKHNKSEIWVELLQENEEEGTTEVSLRNGDVIEVKTKKIYNLISYTPALGERCPIDWE